MTKAGVLEDKLVEFFSEPAARVKPWDLYRELRDFSPVFRSDKLDLWFVTGFEEARIVSAFPDFSYRPDSSSVHEPSAQVGRLRECLYKKNVMFLDPPDHTSTRALVRHTFRGPNAERWRPEIRTWVDELADGLPLDHEFDFVTEVALPLPFRLTCELLGLPFEDWPMLQSYADSFLDLFVPNPTGREDAVADAKLVEFWDYLRPQIDERRAGRRESDLLQEFVDAEERGELTSDEVVMYIETLMVGGHETTAGLLTNGMLLMMEHPDQWRLLCENSDLIASAVEEVLRYSSPSGLVQPKYALRDVEVGGQLIRAGDRVIPQPNAVNRDPREFEEPDTFDIRRRARNYSFGHGPHFCLGSSFARVEAQEMFRVLSARFPDIRLAQSIEDIRYDSNIMLRKPLSARMTVR